MHNVNYNLNESPFGQKPDTKYFYPTRPHAQAIKHMRLGFEQPDGVLVLTGERGIGKTSLISYMLEQLDKNNNIIAFIQEPPQKDYDFLPTVLAALQIPIADNQPKVLFNALRKFLVEQAKLSKKVLLVIDDAESLSHKCLELIRLLSTLRQNENGLIQIVLVGTNELEVVLSSNENQAFRQQIFMSYCMLPLHVSDTREYIEHRLKVAGWDGDPVIDEDAFDAIQQLTGGIPSAINRYCDRLIMPGMLRKAHQIDNSNVSNPTLKAKEKPEKLDEAGLEQRMRYVRPEAMFEKPLPPHSEQKKMTPTQQVLNNIDVDKINFDTPKKTTRFFNKQTIIIIVAAYVVASLSVFVFDKMSGMNLEMLFTKTGIPHTNIKDHSVVDTKEVAPDRGAVSPKYVLEEIPDESITKSKLSNNGQETQLLDIQVLQKKLQLPSSANISSQPDESLAKGALSKELGTSSEVSPQITPEMASNLE